MTKTKDDKEAWIMSAKVCMYSEIFKPTTRPRFKVTMKAVARTLEGVEMLISVNMGGRPEVIFVKTTGIGRGESFAWSGLCMHSSSPIIVAGIKDYVLIDAPGGRSPSLDEITCIPGCFLSNDESPIPIE